MNATRAFCPHCKQDVVFAEVGHFRKCPACGFQFELSEPVPEPTSSVASEVMSAAHVILRVFLILGVVLLVGLGVLFATCATMRF
jgi:uncharacterized protein (DUF983 family)